MNQSEYLAWMQNELRRSKRWRSNGDQNYEKSWKRYIDLYRGKHYDAKNGVDQLTVNMIFATLNVMAPAVAIRNPKFNVNARTPESAPQAILTEEVLNYIWRSNHFQQDFRLGINDWLCIGHGWLKLGYTFQKEPEDKKADDDGDGDEGVGSEMSDRGVDDRVDTPGNTETELIIQTDDDRPYMERISPFDMFVDPDCRHPKEMRWIAQRTWRPQADVKVDSRYSATSRRKVSASSRSKWDESDGGDARDTGDKPDKAIQYVEVIEFYDIKRNRVATFAAHATSDTESDKGGFLIKPEKMPYAFGHPFVMLRNYEVPDHFYPMGDVQQIESLQLELNETRNQMLNYRKKFRRAWLYDQDMFDREGIQALESDDDNVMIPVRGGEDISKAVTPVPVVITPPEFFDQSAMISNDLDRVSGVSDYQRGAQTAIKRTATEAGMIQDAANSRAQDRLDKVETILALCGERIVGLMQQYVTGQKVARIVTIPVRGWVNYDNDRIQGKFDFEVVGGSTEPQNESTRRQSALQAVDMSVPFMQQGVVNMPALYMKLLRDGLGYKDAERYVNQQQQQGPPQGAPPEQGPPQGAPEGPPPGMPPQEGPPQGGDMLDPQMLQMLKQMMGNSAPSPVGADVPPEMMAAMQ